MTGELAAAVDGLVKSGSEGGLSGSVAESGLGFGFLFGEEHAFLDGGGIDTLEDGDLLLFAGSQSERVDEITERKALKGPALGEPQGVTEAERAGHGDGLF